MPYACIGFAQDLDRELDIEYCKKNEISYFRRETGGGTVYLDSDQLFYQLIIRRNNPLTPWYPESFFKRFLAPVVSSLERLGMYAKFVPISDLLVNGKKISGNGGGEIGDCKVLIGNLLLDFDFKKMAAIINAPNKDFQERYYQSMLKNMTTIKNQMGFIPPIEEIKKLIVSEFEKVLGPLTSSELDVNIYESMRKLGKEFNSESWLFQKVPKEKGKELKIREGVFLINKTFRFKNDTLEINFEVEDEKITNLKLVAASNADISERTILDKVVGITFNEKEILNIINEVYG
jgi:lipoate-protein ligase A